jgi:hypothetical protein
MAAFDTETRQISREWLTTSLYDTGFLTAGEVVGIVSKIGRFGTTVTSEFLELELQYSSDMAGNPPSSCLAKIALPVLF